jgi:hypothetical protein
MRPFETHRHGLAPSCMTVAHRGRSYLKWPQMKIATEPLILPQFGEKSSAYPLRCVLRRGRHRRGGSFNRNRWQISTGICRIQ